MITKKQYQYLGSYPKKQTILNNLNTPDKETITWLINWMAIHWKHARKKGEEQKFFALQKMINQLAVIYSNPVILVFNPKFKSCCYSKTKKTIYLNNSFSILSCLHEFGHHLHGPCELQACTWSISHFKAAFPMAYSKLKWKGHLLIKG